MTTSRLLFLLLWAMLLLLGTLPPAAESRRSSGRRHRKGAQAQAHPNSDNEKLFSGLLQANSSGAEGSHRGKRIFSLFNIVTFKNDPCSSTSAVGGVNRNGTCLTSGECGERSGQALGNCAAGFGVCCIFILQTGSTTVTQNCTYIQNENFPAALPNTNAVQFMVQRCNSDVCLLRLDFEMFSIVGTGGSANALEGACMDTFTVTVPTAQVVPVICGVNTGQHMYVNIGSRSGDAATLAFAFAMGNAGASRTWDIKITQVECNNPNAPRDESCLQFLTGLAGRIETFNFDALGDNHLNNQQYSICIRQEEGFCCVEFAVCEDQMAALNGAATAGFSFDTRTATTVAKLDDDCKSATNTIDYISIPQAMATCKGSSLATASKFCGAFLNFFETATKNAPVCDCSSPFTVDVFFNKLGDLEATAAIAIANTKQSKGLCLEYRQVEC